VRHRIAMTITSVVALSFVMFIATPSIHADNRDKCKHAIEKAEANLDKAVRDHGEHSRQAEDRRRDLNAERQRCWDQYHQWWNGKDQRWETEHSWDNDHR
jgi:hypothetical protein